MFFVFKNKMVGVGKSGCQGKALPPGRNQVKQIDHIRKVIAGNFSCRIFEGCGTRKNYFCELNLAIILPALSLSLSSPQCFVV